MYFLLFSLYANIMSLNHEFSDFESFTSIHGVLDEHNNFIDKFNYAEVVSFRFLPFLSGYVGFNQNQDDIWKIGLTGYYISPDIRPIIELSKNNDSKYIRVGASFNSETALLSTNVIMIDKLSLTGTVILESMFVLMPVLEDYYAFLINLGFEYIEKDHSNNMVNGTIGVSFKRLLTDKIVLAPKIFYPFTSYKKVNGVEVDTDSKSRLTVGLDIWVEF